jgi:hypothetical protein
VADNLKFGMWAKKLKQESCSDKERQNLFENIREKTSLIFYSEMKLEWSKEESHSLLYKK